MKEKYTRSYVSHVEYYIGWCVKDCVDVFNQDQCCALELVLNRVATENGFLITQMKYENGLVLICVDCTPQHFVPDMVKGLKGVSARHLFKLFPELKMKLGKSIWNSSYYVGTVKDALDGELERYVLFNKKKIK